MRAPSPNFRILAAILGLVLVIALGVLGLFQLFREAAPVQPSHTAQPAHAPVHPPHRPANHPHSNKSSHRN